MDQEVEQVNSDDGTWTVKVKRMAKNEFNKRRELSSKRISKDWKGRY